MPYRSRRSGLRKRRVRTRKPSSRKYSAPNYKPRRMLGFGSGRTPAGKRPRPRPSRGGGLPAPKVKRKSIFNWHVLPEYASTIAKSRKRK